MACARVGLVLEEHPGIKEFAPESLLWERRRDASAKLCDGEFWFQTAGWSRPRRVGLEVELTVKNREKLEESFRGLTARRDLDQVWWICGDAKVEKVVRHWIAGRAGARQQHFMCDLAEFLSRRLAVEFHDWTGTVVTITPAGATMPERAAEPPPRLPEPAAPAAPKPAAADEAKPAGVMIPPRFEDRYKDPPRPKLYPEPEPSPRPRSWDEQPRFAPSPWREYLALGLAVCAFCAYVCWVLGPVAGPWLDSEKAEIRDSFAAPPPPPRPRAWHNRAPFNNAWDESTWGFRLDRLESRGDLFRMKLRTRLRGWLGDQCAIKGISIASPLDRVLANWDINPPISGAQGWTSLSLVFHAPPKTGELYVGFQLQPEWCRAWQWPVGVR